MRLRNVWSVFWLASIWILTNAESGNNNLTEDVTFDDIAPKNYDYLDPPGNLSDPLNVHINIKKISIRSIDETQMTFSLTIELWQDWTDPRLQYPSWAGERYQVLDSSWIHRLWNPKIYFVNSVDGKLDNIITPSSFFWLTRTNKLYYCCRVILKLICEMDLKYFPHDQQRCGVQIASAIYNEREVKLVWQYYANQSEQLYSLQQFEITDLDRVFCRLQMGLSNVSCLELSIALRRRIGYYLINVYIPTVLIVIMSMLTFWIPYDAVPARVTLGVTSLLTIITKQYQASMPNVSYIVALNVWLSSCIAFVFFSLLEFATVIALSTNMKRVEPNRSYPPDMVLPLVMLRANGTWSMKNSWPRKSGERKKENLAPRKLDIFSRIFFPLSFVVFCIVYWKFYN